METPEYMKKEIDTKYIGSENIIDIQSTTNGTLIFVMKDGQTLSDVKARRLFPLSRKEQYIYFINHKEEEIGIIKKLSLVNPVFKRQIIQALDRYYYIPQILHIDKIDDKYGVFKWYVLTDKGEREFEILNTSTDIKSLGHGQYIIKDIDDNRFEVKDLEKLDRISRVLMEAQL